MAEQTTIDVEPRHLQMVRSVFARHLPFKKVWAYGSRVKWTARKTSDLDCVVFGATDSEIYKAQEAFDESDVPFEVQLLNWETIPDDFKANIKKEYFVLRKESDWGEVKIGDFAQVTSSKRIFLSDYVKKGVPFWRSKEVIEQFRGESISTSLFISESKYIEIKNKFGVPKEGDILLTSVGTIGVPYLVKNNDLFYFKDGNLTWIRGISNDIDSKYVFLWLSSPVGQKTIDGYLIGSSQKALTIDSLRKISLPLPPLPTQRKIAGVLSAYDDLIENNNRRIKILEEMAQRLYKEWFVDFKFPNHENTKFIDSELGKIPEGWLPVKLGTKLKIPKGKNITKKTITDGKIPVVAGGLSPAYYHNKSNAKSPVITISASGANAGYVNLYYEDIWASDCSYINEATTPFVYFYYSLLNDRKIDITRLQRGAAQPHVYPADLMGLDIFNIPDNLMYEFTKNVNPIFNLIGSIRKKNENLRKTRDLLLPRLISGEVSVEDLEVKI